MAVDERSRRAMRSRLEEVLGEEYATTLMEYLPPEEVATKRDLDGLNGRLDGLERNMVAMEQRLNERIDLKTESLENRLHSAIDNLATSVAKDMVAQTRTFIFATLSALATVAALAYTPIGVG
ncbi:MAG: hypothetical protein ACR2MC_05695 [Actinomycetota bacterium]